ncbi:MAG: ABC transporter permease [Chloroflexi bacterium]|nr:ABC transporter permease [Chloroflexota bacterium]
MIRLLDVFVYEFRRGFRRRGYLFMSFGIPLIGLLLLLGFQVLQSSGGADASSDGSAAFGGDDGRLSEAEEILDALEMDENRVSGYVDFTGRFGDPGELSAILVQYPDEEAARAAVESGAISVYYVIPADYLDGGRIRIILPRFSLNLLDTSPIQFLVQAELAQGIDDTVLTRLVDPANIRVTNLSVVGADAGPQDTGAAFVVVYIFTLALLLALFVTNGYLLQSVIEEKETRIVEILLSSLQPTALLGGKILAYGLLGLVQIIAWIAGLVLIVIVAGGEALGDAVGIIATLANLQLPLDVLPLLLIYFVLAYMLFAAFYGVIGAISNSMREGPQYAALLTLPATIPLYFLPFFIEAPNAPLPVILSLFPVTSALAMPQRLVLSSEVPPLEILISLALLALLVAAVMWLAGRMFRVQTLLAGQAPKLREIPRLLRG